MKYFRAATAFALQNALQVFLCKFVTILFVLVYQFYFYMPQPIRPEFLKSFIFELEAFSNDLKIDCILVWQLPSLNKRMVWSSGTFNIFVSWSSVSTLLFLTLASIKVTSNL